VNRVECVEALTDTITGNPLAAAARQWIVEDWMNDNPSISEEQAEADCHGLDAELTRVYLDLAYPGGAEAFIFDHVPDPIGVN
jgi:hypothetical protein